MPQSSSVSPTLLYIIFPITKSFQLACYIMIWRICLQARAYIRLDTVFIQVVAAATINFSLAGVWLLTLRDQKSQICDRTRWTLFKLTSYTNLLLL